VRCWDARRDGDGFQFPHIRVLLSAAALVLYYALYRAPQRWRNLSLIFLGYTFYGWANPKFIFLMFGTTFVIGC